MAENKGFIFFYSYGEMLNDLSDEQFGKLIRAASNYGEVGIVPEFDDLALKIAFKYLQRNIDEGNEKYRQLCESNSEKGRKGGAPEGNRNAVKNKPQVVYEDENKPEVEKTSQTTQENDKENINNKENIREKVIKTSAPAPVKTRYAEFVSMTNDEYSSLVAELGEDGAKRCVEILNNYKGQNGKTYKSDYRAILNWVVDRYREEQAKKPRSVPKSDGYIPTGNSFDISELESASLMKYAKLKGSG